MTDGKNHSPKKIFDIKRPGKTPAEPTSRPVIVGHKPEFHDDMIGGNTSKLGSKDKRPLLNALAKVTIQPSKQIEDKEPVAPETRAPEPPASMEPTPTPAPETPVPQSPIPETPQPQPQSQSQPAPPAPEPASDPLANPSFNLPTESDPATHKPKPLSEKLLEDAAKAPENPNPMTRHGDQVYVSHHKSKLTFGGVLAALLVIMFLTVVAVNFLLDADIIKTELDVPHTNWF